MDPHFKYIFFYYRASWGAFTDPHLRTTAIMSLLPLVFTCKQPYECTSSFINIIWTLWWLLFSCSVTSSRSFLWNSTHNLGRRSSHVPPVTNRDEMRSARASNSKWWQRIKSIIVTGNHPDGWVEVSSYTRISSARCDSSAVSCRSTWCSLLCWWSNNPKKTTAWRWARALTRGHVTNHTRGSYGITHVKE